VKLNGLPAFQYSMRLTPSAFRGVTFSPSPSPTVESVTTVDYVVYHDGFIYSIALQAPTPRWPSAEPALNSVAQSFTATP
jgi:hypothetical protein